MKQCALRPTFLLAVFCATSFLASAQTVKTLAVFDDSNGAWPSAALIQGTDGNLYGTTQTNVFQMTPSGKVTSIYTVCSVPTCIYSLTAVTALIQANDNNLYGTTTYGGTDINAGTLFKITAGGRYVVLHTFCSGYCTDGANPNSLVQGVDGNLYGTTSSDGIGGGGTIFKLTPAGTLTTLYAFCTKASCADGMRPMGGLLQSSDGNFYGTTYQGGLFGAGTVFKITPAGTLTTIYDFCAQLCMDGESPIAGLVQGNDGDFYGTTYEGGRAGNGTIFKITPDGSFTSVYSFCTQLCTDGLHPTAALVYGSDGNFYGTTNGDIDFCLGSFNCGTLFQFSPAGVFTRLDTFCSVRGCGDGFAPFAPLLQDTNGYFYGSSQLGGSFQSSTCEIQEGCGTTFGLSMGLAPFVAASPTFGKSGNYVRILGTNLTGTTSVTFDGTPALFTVVSKHYIKAIVPNGASSGFIQVTTPTNTLSSNKAFIVVP